MFGLKEKHIEAVHHCFEKYSDIELVVLYGSRAKGNNKNNSDIDLTIVGNITYRQTIQLENELDDLLLPYKIDLSLKNNISNQDLIAHIERVGKVFYNKTKKIVLHEPAVEYKTLLNKAEQ